MARQIAIELPYGKVKLPLQVPVENLLSVLEPAADEQFSMGDDPVAEALRNPVDSPRLSQIAKAGQKIVIVTSDLTRPCPSRQVLPLLLRELSVASVSDEQVTIVIALGTHRPMTQSEMEDVVGREICQRFRVLNHDPDDTICIGVTQRGTPVEIFRPVVEADFRVCLGNLELHYFAGFSGGVKAIFPGCASKAAITANHAWMVEPGARPGKLEGNPVREDIEEAGTMLGVDFILNVIVDSQHRILAAFAGDPKTAHSRGCDYVRQRGVIALSKPADIVVASAGGYPKDINLYQAQKALDNASYAVRDGGCLILVAECPEGFGHPTFAEWMVGANQPERLLKRIQDEFVLGGHKAAAIAAVLKRARICLISAMPDEIVRDSGMIPYQNLNLAVQDAIHSYDGLPRILVMPQAGSILPIIE